MKDTPPSWLADTPDWERREIQRHYRPDSDSLHSSYLSGPVPLAEARERRREGEPLEYILAHCHAGSFTLKTDSRALVPRPETENLVRRVREDLKDRPDGPVVDCGTGSGFIAGMIAGTSSRLIVGVDRFEDPLELARENRRLHGWRIELLRADRLRALAPGLACVVANLPYVRKGSRRLETSVREHEPSTALFAAGDRLSFYEEFHEQAADRLRPGGVLWMELEPDLADRLHGSLRSASAWSTVRRLDDGFGVERFLRAERRKTG